MLSGCLGLYFSLILCLPSTEVSNSLWNVLALIAKFFLGPYQGFHSDPDFLSCLSLEFWRKVLIHLPLNYEESVLPLYVKIMSAACLHPTYLTSLHWWLWLERRLDDLVTVWRCPLFQGKTDVRGFGWLLESFRRDFAVISVWTQLFVWMCYKTDPRNSSG